MDSAAGAISPRRCSSSISSSSCCCRSWCWCGRRCSGSTARRPGRRCSRLSLDSYRTILDYPQFWLDRAQQPVPRAHDCDRGDADRRRDLAGWWCAPRSRAAGCSTTSPRCRWCFPGLVLGLSIMICYLYTRHRRLRHDLDPADRLHDALPALRHALHVDLDAADPQGAGGIRRHERRLLGAHLPPRRAAAAQARAAGGLDLHRDRLDPRAVELDPALQPGHRSGVDHDLGAVAERPVCASCPRSASC